MCVNQRRIIEQNKLMIMILIGEISILMNVIWNPIPTLIEFIMFIAGVKYCISPSKKEWLLMTTSGIIFGLILPTILILIHWWLFKM